MTTQEPTDNAMYTLGHLATAPQTETRMSERQRPDLTFPYPLAGAPTITRNGITEAVGIKGIDTGRDWYWAMDDAIITRDCERAAQDSDGDALVITYQGYFPIAINTRALARLVAAELSRFIRLQSGTHL